MAEKKDETQFIKKPDVEDDVTDSWTLARREWLRKYLARSLGISMEPPPVCLLEELTLEGIAKYIASDKCHKIITMAGAGISTSAGIPDYRTQGTGLFNNLDKFNVPSPQSIFSIDGFNEDPEKFYKLASERKVLWSRIYKPTPCHYFLRLLAEKGKLLKHFTQNIDSLERLAGIDAEKLVEAHGTVRTSHCLKCQREYTQDWMRETVYSGKTPWCVTSECGGIIKPDVVLFGESLPQRFQDNVELLEQCDMLIILGTSLVVRPFASLTSRVKESTPRLYINLEKSGNESTHPLMVLMFGGGFDFDGTNNIRDVFWQGTCDDGCYALADHIGWGDELRQLVKTEHARLDIEMAAEAKTSTHPPVDKQEPANIAFKAQTKTSASSTDRSSVTSKTTTVARGKVQGKTQPKSAKQGKAESKVKKP